MEIMELLTISFFVVAITTSWKATQATPAYLSLKEMSFNAWSMVWQWFWMASTLASKSC
jgi:hypothetical protein